MRLVRIHDVFRDKATGKTYRVVARDQDRVTIVRCTKRSGRPFFNTYRLPITRIALLVAFDFIMHVRDDHRPRPTPLRYRGVGSMQEARAA